MDRTETAQLHTRDQYAYEAIRDCVHDATCRHGPDHMHPRIEMEMCRVSWEVTRLAQKQRDSREPS